MAGLPGVSERDQTLRLWVRRKSGERKLVCSGCGRSVSEIAEVCEREIRDLPCFEYRTTVVIELYRVRCPDCGVKTERVAQLPSKAPFSKRFEDAVGEACESAAARRVAKQVRLAASTVRAIARPARANPPGPIERNHHGESGWKTSHCRCCGRG
jgi:transposase